MVIACTPKGNKHKQAAKNAKARDPRALAPTPPARYASPPRFYDADTCGHDPWAKPRYYDQMDQPVTDLWNTPIIRGNNTVSKKHHKQKQKQKQKQQAKAKQHKQAELDLTGATVRQHPAPRYYLAYGSNLSRAGMRSRCRDAVYVGPIMMQDARLVFRGVADIEYHSGSTVPCGLWRISARDEDALDAYEGYRAHAPSEGMYDKLDITLSDGRKAMFYMMNSQGVYPPSQYYADVIRQGYRDFGLDQAYLDAAIKRSFLKKEPDDQTHYRRQRQRVKNSPHKVLVTMPEAVALARVAQRLKALELEEEA